MWLYVADVKTAADVSRPRLEETTQFMNKKLKGDFSMRSEEEPTVGNYVTSLLSSKTTVSQSVSQSVSVLLPLSVTRFGQEQDKQLYGGHQKI